MSNKKYNIPIPLEYEIVRNNLIDRCRGYTPPDNSNRIYITPYQQKLWVVNPKTGQGGYMDSDVVNNFVTIDQMQETLDKDYTLDALSNEWRLINKSVESTPSSSKKEPCTHDWQHQWKEYRGFSEDYEFCLTCDKKRDRFTKKEIK